MSVMSYMRLLDKLKYLLWKMVIWEIKREGGVSPSGKVRQLIRNPTAGWIVFIHLMNSYREIKKSYEIFPRRVKVKSKRMPGLEQKTSSRCRRDVNDWSADDICWRSRWLSEINQIDSQFRETRKTPLETDSVVSKSS